VSNVATFRALFGDALIIVASGAIRTAVYVASAGLAHHRRHLVVADRGRQVEAAGTLCSRDELAVDLGRELAVGFGAAAPWRGALRETAAETRRRLRPSCDEAARRSG
jgi:hypothetical protein